MSIENRLMALEEKVAHQDDTIETLNQTVTEQWKLIEQLKKQIGHLDSQLYELENHMGNPAANQKPPHY